MDLLGRDKVTSLVHDYYGMSVQEFFSKEFVQNRLVQFVQGLPTDGDAKLKQEEITTIDHGPWSHMKAIRAWVGTAAQDIVFSFALLIDL